MKNSSFLFTAVPYIFEIVIFVLLFELALIVFLNYPFPVFLPFNFSASCGMAVCFFHFCVRLVDEPCKSGHNTVWLVARIACSEVKFYSSSS